MAAEHYYWGIDSTDFDSYSDDLPAGLPDGLPDGMLAMVKRTMLMANRQAPEWRLARERAAAKLEALREARSDRDGAALARRDVRMFLGAQGAPMTLMALVVEELVALAMLAALS